MRYRVRHTTTYRYDEPVTDSYGVCRLVPRSLPWQSVESYAVAVEPAPDDLAHEVDHDGNHTSYFQVRTPHTALVVEGSGVVEVVAALVEDAALARPWESLRPLVEPRADGAWLATDVVLPSPLVAHEPAAHAYAAPSLGRGRPVGEAVGELVARIHADFEYDRTATTVTSTIGDILEQRAGVCQDFAHLALACLRSHGLAARYVSGYLATTPPPGQARLEGADASHAWVAVWLGGDRWLALDPTNDTRADERYVTVAWGRDYGDVPPVKGVIFTEATRSTLQVSVDVAPIA